MITVGQVRIVALLMVPGTGLAPSCAAAQAGMERIDRTVVSPFSGSRRIVVRPGPDGGSEVVAVGASFDAPAPVAPVAAPAIAPLPFPAAALPAAGAFIDIGPLDAAPAAAPLPEGRTDYLDIGPYDGGILFVPAPLSSFPPD